MVGVKDSILSAHRPLFSMGAVAEQRSVEPAAGLPLNANAIKLSPETRMAWVRPRKSVPDEK